MSKLTLSTCAVIMYQNKMLILQRNANEDFMPLAWEFPGGGVEEKETIAEGLVREILEETGFTVSSSDLKFLGISEEFTTKDMSERYLQINFMIKCDTKPVITLSSEHCAYDWVDAKDERLDDFLQQILKQISK